jgi:hypothetical protein
VSIWQRTAQKPHTCLTRLWIRYGINAGAEILVMVREVLAESKTTATYEERADAQSSLLCGVPATATSRQKPKNYDETLNASDCKGVKTAGSRNKVVLGEQSGC